MPNTEDIDAALSFETAKVYSSEKLSDFHIDNSGTMTDRIKGDYHEQRIGQSKWAFNGGVYG